MIHGEPKNVECGGGDGVVNENTVKTPGNRSPNIGEIIMLRIRSASHKHHDQQQKTLGQNIVHFGAWHQESEKLETSLVSNPLWDTDGQDL